MKLRISWKNALQIIVMFIIILLLLAIPLPLLPAHTWVISSALQRDESSVNLLHVGIPNNIKIGRQVIFQDFWLTCNYQLKCYVCKCLWGCRIYLLADIFLTCPLNASLLLPGPPNFDMSRQYLQDRQSLARHPGHAQTIFLCFWSEFKQKLIFNINVY